MNILELYKIQKERMILSSWFEIDGKLFLPIALKDVPNNEIIKYITTVSIEDFSNWIFIFNSELNRRRIEKINQLKKVING